MTGTLISWFEKRSYGFIKQDNGSDIFCHVSDFAGSLPLSVGCRCEFEISEYKNKPKAVNIRSLDSKSGPDISQLLADPAVLKTLKRIVAESFPVPGTPELKGVQNDSRN